MFLYCRYLWMYFYLLYIIEYTKLYNITIANYFLYRTSHIKYSYQKLGPPSVGMNLSSCIKFKLFWCSSSFCSSHWLRSKVRNVRSSGIPKFRSSKFRLFGFFRSQLKCSPAVTNKLRTTISS